MRRFITAVAAMAVLALAGHAHASCGNGGGQPSNGCDGGSTGSLTASSAASAVSRSISGASAIGVGGSGGNAHSQATGGNAAGGAASASYEGYTGQSVTVEGARFDRYAPSAAAPALTSAGTTACLGSFSGGLVGPMAGAMFGKTYESAKCEARSGSALLWQYASKPGPRAEAFERASLRVLAGEPLKDALMAEGLLPAVPVKAATKSNAEAVTVPASMVYQVEAN